MPCLTIRIIGNGGCLNTGLPYNACLIDNRFLLETPPDIMLSLQQLGVDYNAIDTIFISHLHGDHTFGLPFFMIQKWMAALESETKIPVTVLGPSGIESYMKNLIEAAFSRIHPCCSWFEDHFTFQVIDDHSKMTWNGLECSFFPVEHFIETYGISMAHNHRNLFAYTADTRWCASVELMLAKKTACDPDGYERRESGYSHFFG